MTDNLQGKTFIRHLDGSLIKVSRVEGDVAVLENNSKINITSLLDTTQFSSSNQQPTQIQPNNTGVQPNYNGDTVDPNIFNKSGSGFYGNIVKDLKGIPDSNLDGIDGGEQVSMDVPVVESHTANRQQNLERAIEGVPPNVAEKLKQEAIKNQQKLEGEIRRNNNSMASLLGEEADNSPIDAPPNYAPNEPPVNPGSVGINPPVQPAQTQPAQTQPAQTQPAQTQADPISSMFKGLKRSEDFLIEFKVDEKIPPSDILKMFEDGHESSVLDYLSEEFFNKIMSDPNKIKNQIRKNLEIAVYGKLINKEEDALIILIEGLEDTEDFKGLKKSKLVEICNYLKLDSKGTNVGLTGRILNKISK